MGAYSRKRGEVERHAASVGLAPPRQRRQKATPRCTLYPPASTSSLSRLSTGLTISSARRQKKENEGLSATNWEKEKSLFLLTRLPLFFLFDRKTKIRPCLTLRLPSRTRTSSTSTSSSTSSRRCHCTRISTRRRTSSGCFASR